MPKAGEAPKDPLQELFGDAMHRVAAGPIYYELQRQIAGLKVPLPEDHASKIADAIVVFQQLPIEKKVEALNSMLADERLEKRVAWPLAAAPTFQVPPEPHQQEAVRVMNEVARELLRTCTLPREQVYGLIETIGQSLLIPPSPAATMMKVVGGVALSTAVISFTPWWAWMPALTCSYLVAKPFLSNPDGRHQYVKGCMLENVDALAQVQSGRAIPFMTSFRGYFADPEIPRSCGNRSQMEGFLISRVLRVLGAPSEEIRRATQFAVSAKDPGSALLPTIAAALEPHGAQLDTPLSIAVKSYQEGKSSETFEFIELMNATHFAWVARDRDNLRGEFADIILQANA